jgi:hypothetical protein
MTFKSIDNQLLANEITGRKEDCIKGWLICKQLPALSYYLSSHNVYSVFGLGSGLGEYLLQIILSKLIDLGGPVGGWINDTLGWSDHRP